MDSPTDTVTFVSQSIYNVLPLPFGGFLAIDPDFMYLYADSKNLCIDARKLRQGVVFSAILQYDEFDKETMLTKQGKDFLRYIAATEGGELYMIAFHLQVLKELTQNGTKTLSEASTNPLF